MCGFVITIPPTAQVVALREKAPVRVEEISYNY